MVVLTSLRLSNSSIVRWRLPVAAVVWQTRGGGKRSFSPKLTCAEARSAQGTNTGHENGEGMASVGVHVERSVRRWRVGKAVQVNSAGVILWVMNVGSGYFLA